MFLKIKYGKCFFKVSSARRSFISNNVSLGSLLPNPSLNIFRPLIIVFPSVPDSDSYTDSDPLVGGTDPDRDGDPSVINQK